MITESARVVAVKTNSIWVETISQSSCGSCQARSGCGQQTLNRWFSRFNLIQVPLPKGARIPQVDEQVRIGVPERLVANSALLIYCLPLLLMLMATVLADAWFTSDGAVAAMTLAALLVAGVGVRFYTHRRERRDWQPVLLENGE